MTQSCDRCDTDSIRRAILDCTEAINTGPDAAIDLLTTFKPNEPGYLFHVAKLYQARYPFDIAPRKAHPDPLMAWSKHSLLDFEFTGARTGPFPQSFPRIGDLRSGLCELFSLIFALK